MKFAIITRELSILDIACTVLELLVPIQLTALAFLWGYSLASVLAYLAR